MQRVKEKFTGRTKTKRWISILSFGFMFLLWGWGTEANSSEAVNFTTTQVQAGEAIEVTVQVRSLMFGCAMTP